MTTRKKGMDELFEYQQKLRRNGEKYIDNDILFNMYNNVIGEEKIKIRNMIVENNLQLLINFLIKKYNYTMEENPVFDMEDIIQQSSLILIEAIGQYDSSKGKFSTFLYHKLSNAIYYINGIPNSAIEFPRGFAFRYKVVKMLIDLDYDDAFISKYSKLPLSTLKWLRPLLNNSISYEELLNCGKIDEFIKIKDEQMGDYLISRIIEQPNVDDRNQEILNILKKLSMRDRHLLIRMFGFDGCETDIPLSKLKEDFGFKDELIYSVWKNIKIQIRKDELLKDLFYDVDSEYDDHNFDKTYYLQK